MILRDIENITFHINALIYIHHFSYARFIYKSMVKTQKNVFPILCTLDNSRHRVNEMIECPMYAII